MILDFRANQVFIVFSIVLGFGVAAYLRFNDTEWVFIGGILTLYAILTAFQLKRNTFRFIQNYEVVLMIRLQATPYKEAYQALVAKGKRINPIWTLTKHQRLAMGHLFEGNPKEAVSVIEATAAQFQVFLENDSYSFYLNQVILGLAGLFENDPQISGLIQKEKEAFKALPIKAQERLSENASGYHQLFELVERLEPSQDFEKDFKAAFEEKTNFMKVVLFELYQSRLKETYEVPEHQLFTLKSLD
jgi:hypothetical protein